MRESGSATRSVSERALQRAGVKLQAAMELDHGEVIKRSVMAGLGVTQQHGFFHGGVMGAIGVLRVACDDIDTAEL